MKVRYIYSACVEIKTSDVSILCDPWFTDGAFDGSWFHYPKINDPFKILNKPDYIYISHIHPDHYDPIFLKKILKKYRKTKIIIPNFERNYLYNRMKFDGIDARPTNHVKVGNTNIHLVPNEHEITDIDSAIVVNDKNKTVVGLVDCVFNRKFGKSLKNLISIYTKKINLLMIPHSGANEVPHTHFDVTSQKKKLSDISNQKKIFNIKRYLNWSKNFNSNYNLPYAGKYVIGGKNIKFNKYYGVSDPVDIKKYDPKAIVLSDYGGQIDLQDGKISGERKKKYDQKKLNKYLNKIKNFKYNYENDIKIPFKDINFQRLLNKAYLKAIKMSKVKNDYFFCLKLLHNNKKIDFSAVFNVNVRKKPKIEFYKNTKRPGVTIYIDYRLLFGLLTGLYHWNNASVGSLYISKRDPYIFNKKARDFINFFNI